MPYSSSVVTANDEARINDAIMDRADTVTLENLGVCGMTYEYEYESGDPYVLVGFSLFPPDNKSDPVFLANLDETGICGSMSAFRYYYDPALDNRDWTVTVTLRPGIRTLVFPFQVTARSEVDADTRAMQHLTDNNPTVVPFIEKIEVSESK